MKSTPLIQTPPTTFNLQRDPMESSLNGKSYIHEKTGLEMVHIPAGKFLMGDDEEYDNPCHTVMLSDYYISRTLVSVEQYLKFCDATGYRKPSPPDFNEKWSKRDHPIVNVSWYDAQAYCKWAGLKLPTEAQWEKAANGTTGYSYPLKKRTVDSSQLYWKVIGDAGSTVSVNKFMQGPYNLYDMAGNALQWCRDTYDADFWKHRPSGERDPINEKSDGDRVLRGSCWVYVRPDNERVYFQPTYNRDDYLGFRCIAGP